jgi:hypothetical protein
MKDTNDKNYKSVPDEESLGDDLVKPLPTGKPRYRKKGKSCLTWCLIIVGVMIALFMLLATVMATMAYVWMRHEVIRFTVLEPLDLPIDVLPDSELDMVKDRAMLFFDTLKAGWVPADDLTLSVDELNGFIAHSDFLRGNAYATVSENEISVDLSLPMNSLPGGNERYFVANWDVVLSQPLEDKALITTKLETYSPVEGLDGPILYGKFLTYWQSQNDSELAVNLQSGQFLKWTAPKDFIDEKLNLMDDMCGDDDDDCTDVKRIIEGIHSVSIFRNRRIVIQAKRNAGHILKIEDDQALDIAVERSTTTFLHDGARRLVTKVLFN